MEKSKKTENIIKNIQTVQNYLILTSLQIHTSPRGTPVNNSIDGKNTKNKNKNIQPPEESGMSVNNLIDGKK